MIESKQSKGAKALNASLTASQRKQNTKKGIEARWKKQKGENWSFPLPESKYKGTMNLGGAEVECHVLSNGERVISYRQCVKLITDSESGDLASYVEISALKDLIPNSLDLAENIEFKIPNSPNAKGLRAETFAEICNAYIEAAYKKLLKTDRQREIALNCSFIMSGCGTVGLIALIDEATGYQNYRANDELRKKFSLYIQEKQRPWIKTWSDEFYIELARLCKAKDWRKKQPHYAQITNKIYSMVDPEVQQKLKELDVNPNIHQHQYLSEFGVHELKKRIQMATGLAVGCENIQEFNAKMKLFEPGGAYQMNFNFTDEKSKVKKIV